MATNTTKLGLIKPDLTDIVDIGDLNDNADDIDAAVGAAIVTSTTRPSAPWTGQIIHETDTDKTLVWDGVAWVETGTAVEDLDDLSDVTVTSGASGDALVYNGTGWVNQPRAGRNLLYNGAMQVHQRSTSVTGITGLNYNTADRWQNVVVSMGTWTETIENDAPTGSGFRKSWKTLCTTADSSPAAADQLRVRTRLEGQDLQAIRKGTSSAQPLSLSFWVKSNVTGTYVAGLIDDNNSRNVGATYTINASATWEKKTILFPADTTGALNNDNGNSLELSFWLGAGSDNTSGTLNTSWASTVTANRAAGQTNLAAATNNYWQITGVQLEVGPVATPFEFKPYGQELLECQRYYYRTAPGANNKILGNGYNNATTAMSGIVTFPVKMRETPTALEQSGTANNYMVVHGSSGVTVCSAVPTFSAKTSDSIGAFNFIVASGLTVGQASDARTDGINGTNAFLAWSTEL